MQGCETYSYGAASMPFGLISQLRLTAIGFLLLSCDLAQATLPNETPASPPSFSRDVLPILRANCFGCHQDAKKLGGYLMTDFQAMRSGGESAAPAIVPGKSAESYLVKEIVPVDGKSEMPKKGKPLSEAEIDIIRRWIDAGAVNDAQAVGPRFTSAKPPVYVQPPTITSIDFSKDGKQVAVTGFHETLVFSVADWKLQKRLVGFSPRIESIRYS